MQSPTGRHALLCSSHDWQVLGSHIPWAQPGNSGGHGYGLYMQGRVARLPEAALHPPHHTQREVVNHGEWEMPDLPKANLSYITA